MSMEQWHRAVLPYGHGALIAMPDGAGDRG